MIEQIEKIDGKKIYNINFSNLTDLYDYLKSNPKVNKNVFTKQSSITGTSNWAGADLDTSIEYILGGYKKDFDNFLKLSNELRSAGTLDDDARSLKRGLFGGKPLASLVAAGVPDCMLRYDRDQETKYVTIYFNLGYPSYTSENAIINRGLITLYLVQALEERGYIVDFKAFELSRKYNEIVNININLKKPGDLFLNIEKCYFPIKGKEFLRRILFRVLESASVTNDWEDGYGRPLQADEIKDFFNASDNDLIISYPSEMKIKGYNIYYDAINLIKLFNLEDEFNMENMQKLKSKRND